MVKQGRSSIVREDLVDSGHWSPFLNLRSSTAFLRLKDSADTQRSNCFLTFFKNFSSLNLAFSSSVLTEGARSVTAGSAIIASVLATCLDRLWSFHRWRVRFLNLTPLTWPRYKAVSRRSDLEQRARGFLWSIP